MSAIDWKATLERDDVFTEGGMAEAGEAMQRIRDLEKPRTHLTFGWTPRGAAQQDITIQVASHVRFAFTHWRRVDIKAVTVHP